MLSDVYAGIRVASVAQANNEFGTWSANFPDPEVSDPATGKFTITRRVPGLTGLSDALWISSDLENRDELQEPPRMPGTPGCHPCERLEH